MTIRDIAIAFGYKVDKKSEKSVEKSIGELKNTARKALAVIGAGFSLVKANALIEEFKQVNLQLKNAVGNAEDFAEVQKEVLEAANNVRVSYSTMSSYVKSLMNSQNKLFSSTEKTLEFAELTTKAMKAAGANESAISSLNNGIQSAFETGKVSAGTFTTLMQNCPDAVTYLAQTLGVTKQQVKALGTAGAITSNQLYKAFTSNATSINGAYSDVSYTIRDAITMIRNEFGAWLYQMDDVLDLTHNISKMMLRAFSVIMSGLKKVTAGVEKLNNKFGSTEKTVQFLGATIGSVVALLSSGKIIQFIQMLKPLLSAVSAKVVAIIAVVLLLVMVVEDFIHFLMGNDSMFGEILSSMGVDVEETRNTILEAFNRMKEAFGELFDVIKSTIGVIFEAYKPTLKSLIELLVQLVVDIIPLLCDYLTLVAKYWSFVFSAVQPLVKLFFTLVNAILKPLIEVLKVVVSILTGALSGAIEGLTDLLTPLISALEWVVGLFEKVLGFASEGLGGIGEKISSWVGKFGGEDTRENVKSGVKGFFGKVKNVFGFVDSAKTPTSAATTLGNETNNRNLNQTVNITNQFNGGTTDQQKTGAKAMKKSAADATGIMARGLAYAR